MKRRIITRSSYSIQNIENQEETSQTDSTPPSPSSPISIAIPKKLKPSVDNNRITKQRAAVIYNKYDNIASCTYNKITKSKTSSIEGVTQTTSDELNKSNENFYLSTHTIKLIPRSSNRNNKSISINHDLDIYQQIVRRPYPRGYAIIKLQVYTIVLSSDASDYNLVNDDDNNDDFDANKIVYELEVNDTLQTILNLNSQKCLFLVFNAFNFEANYLNVDIYLTSKLKYPSLTDNPSECINIKLTKSVQNLFNKFFNVSIYDDIINNAENQDESIIIDEDKQETLFDLIYYEHQRQITSVDFKNISIDFGIHSYLLDILRPYQINAIKWMLKRENINSSDENLTSTSKLHPLYVNILNKNNEKIFLQKYIGVYTYEQPIYTNSSMPGGILADEMGLGKTLEVLGCIILNPRINYPKFKIQIDNEKFQLNKKSANFSCICGNVPKDASENSQVAYQCRSCAVWTHIKCVNYTGIESEFLCPRCCTLQTPYPSGCTLIVTPSVISHQWIEEIKKHINKPLKVLLYQGCSYHGFIQPKDLASLDVCITSYDVLSSELNHVWSMDNLPNLRRVKRFMSLPSPLVCVEWWRVCLDEAQMVHSTNAKCAAMANRLFAVNRWCVTGTPIGRSLSDLHGLFAFIREDPYYEKRWFNDLLYDPYRMGNKKPMVDALSRVLWRTAKRFVLDQV